MVGKGGLFATFPLFISSSHQYFDGFVQLRVSVGEPILWREVDCDIGLFTVVFEVSAVHPVRALLGHSCACAVHET